MKAKQVIFGCMLAALLMPFSEAAAGEDFVSCARSEDCRVGGCSGRVCANQQSYRDKSPVFEGMLGACTDALTPFEKMMYCGCQENKCQWVTPADEDAVIKQAALYYFREHITPCPQGTVSVTIKEKTADRAKVSVLCECGMDCMHFCNFEVEKRSGYWKVEDQEMECAVS